MKVIIVGGVAGGASCAARALVDQPGAVSVIEVNGSYTSIVEFRVAKEDIGKIIGMVGALIGGLLKVGTAIHFEIDRLFRERGIEIAFPQRDIHIRSSVTAQPTNEFTVEVEPPEKKAAPSQS